MSETKKKYLLTGGGTGGHVYPAIAIADELKRREADTEFLYVGVQGKAEEKIVPARGYPIAFVTSRGWPGAKLRPAFLMFALSLAWGIFRSIRIIREFKPDVILATGGYVSAPIMLAWVLLKRLKMTEAKAFVHEQNLVPGRLNRLVGKLANRVGVSFEESRRFFPNAQWVGYPARSEISGEDKAEAREQLGIPADASVVLAFGGSQGSRSINRAVVDGLEELLRDESVYVIHGTGRYRGSGYNPQQDTQTRLAQKTLGGGVLKRYTMQDYLDPIERYYAAADVVICRAGAGSLTEVALCGLPAIIIPKANLPGDHQVRNAQALSTKGAGHVVYETTKQEQEGLIESVDGKALAKAVLGLLQDKAAQKAMREAMKEVADPTALARIVDCVEQVATDTLPELPPLPERTNDRPELSEFGGAALVRYIAQNGVEALNEEEYDYLTYRTDGYLAQSTWQTRNIGVKLVGLLQLESRLDALLYILHDPTPATRWQRWVGGDRMQVGFIRRNTVLSIQRIGIWNDDVKKALLAALEDPYFEVRSWAAKATVAFAEPIGQDSAILQALDQLCTDRAFEVVCEAIRALGEIDERTTTYTSMRRFFTHPNWRVRQAVVYCLQRWVERKILSSEVIQSDLEHILVTSSGFVPHFQLREQIRTLSQALEQV